MMTLHLARVCKILVEQCAHVLRGEGVLIISDDLQISRPHDGAFIQGRVLLPWQTISNRFRTSFYWSIFSVG